MSLCFYGDWIETKVVIGWLKLQPLNMIGWLKLQL